MNGFVAGGAPGGNIGSHSGLGSPATADAAVSLPVLSDANGAAAAGFSSASTAVVTPLDENGAADAQHAAAEAAAAAATVHAMGGMGGMVGMKAEVSGASTADTAVAGGEVPADAADESAFATAEGALPGSSLDCSLDTTLGAVGESASPLSAVPVM